MNKSTLDEKLDQFQTHLHAPENLDQKVFAALDVIDRNSKQLKSSRRFKSWVFVGAIAALAMVVLIIRFEQSEPLSTDVEQFEIAEQLDLLDELDVVENLDILEDLEIISGLEEPS